MGLNEYLLYHGAPSDKVRRLIEQGLDPRHAGSHFGKLFGSGVYFASNSSKSDIYTQPNAAGERCVLVVRTCLGEPHHEKTDIARREGWLKPPERPDQRGPLSSIVAVTMDMGGCVEHPEYIVYKDSQSLPQFAIWYVHSDECRCTHCWLTSKITIAVVHENFAIAHFEVRRGEKLGSHFAEFKVQLLGSVVNGSDSTVKFNYGGTELTGDETAHDLGMVDGAKIELVVAQKIIYIMVITPQGDEIRFKAKMDTRMKRIMDVWCSRHGVSQDDVRFFFEGEPVSPDKTPADLGMEDSDTINVVINSSHTARILNIIVVDEDGFLAIFTTEPTKKLEKVMNAWCNGRGVPRQNFRFQYNGVEVTDSDTAEELGITEGDRINAAVQ